MPLGVIRAQILVKLLLKSNDAVPFLRKIFDKLNSTHKSNFLCYQNDVLFISNNNYRTDTSVDKYYCTIYIKICISLIKCISKALITRKCTELHIKLS